ncbi:ABC transporter permease [Akkermansia massiliensis]|uniref:ABC transporter permease n=1 Tax=Akkermansia massiliensis TaxID=2927224 RepID=UPI003F7CBCEA
MNFFLALIPIIAVLGVWEIYSQFSSNVFFLFSRPSEIIDNLWTNSLNGELPQHAWITFIESFVGLILGVGLGSILGFILLFKNSLGKIVYPYLVFLSSIPIIALAPMMIIWFGIGIQMKIAIVFLSTVFVAAFQAYRGGKNIDPKDSIFFKLNNASSSQYFRMLTFPAAIDWLIQSLRLNIGFAILGAFIGEFIASDQGLGFSIMKSSGLYDVANVMSSIIYLIALTILFNFIAKLLEINKIRVIRFLALKI